jgi:hypothetical protein
LLELFEVLNLMNNLSDCVLHNLFSLHYFLCNAISGRDKSKIKKAQTTLVWAFFIHVFEGKHTLENDR